MKLKHANSYGEIVLERKLNHMQLLVLIIVKIELKNGFNTLFFQEFAKIPAKRKLCNFHITYPNGILHWIDREETLH